MKQNSQIDSMVRCTQKLSLPIVWDPYILFMHRYWCKSYSTRSLFVTQTIILHKRQRRKKVPSWIVYQQGVEQIRTDKQRSAYCGGTGRLSAFAIVTTRGLNTPSRVRLMTSRNPSSPPRLSSSRTAETTSHPISLTCSL